MLNPCQVLRSIANSSAYNKQGLGVTAISVANRADEKKMSKSFDLIAWETEASDAPVQIEQVDYFDARGLRRV